MHAFLQGIGKTRVFTPAFVAKKTMMVLFFRISNRKPPATTTQQIHPSAKAEGK